MGKRITRVCRKTMEALQRHPWPVRQRSQNYLAQSSTVALEV